MAVIPFADPQPDAISWERTLIRRLQRQLVALRSMLPTTARSSPFSIIADALRYKETLKREIQRLSSRPEAFREVQVEEEGSDLRIEVVCGKKNGLLIALMEVIEGSGLIFSDVSVCCEDGITIRARSTQGSASPDSLKSALMTTIDSFHSLP